MAAPSPTAARFARLDDGAAHYESYFLKATAPRGGLGRRSSPWIANGVLCLRGRRLRVGGLTHLPGTRLHEQTTRCCFAIPGARVRIEGEVAAEPERFVGWRYAQPAGGERFTVNCSIADMRLEVTERAGRTERLAVAGSAAYEPQSPRLPATVPMQRFAEE